jgi:hypothetical protein
MFLEEKSEKLDVSIQEEYHSPHAPLVENSNLSYVQSESSDDNELKDKFDEPLLYTHEDLIQHDHGENVAVGSQWPQLVYTELKEGCQHGINESDNKSYHLTLNLQVVDCSYGVEFNEEKIFQASKEEGCLQQEVPWMVYVISEDNEIVGEQQKTTLQFSTNVQQQFIFATSPWHYYHFIMEECLRSIANKQRLSTMAGSNQMSWLCTWLHWKSTYT